ncbi:MAG: DNA polymerase II [Oceanospirillaceae bacterium]|nr:DNA polymerase II [Oceanospirillaceae bacterium]
MAPKSSSTDAFLLTSHWRDLDDGQNSELTFWWTTPLGILRQRIKQPAVCFIQATQAERAETMATTLGWPIEVKPLGLVNFQQQRVAGCYMPGGYLRRWSELLREQDIPCWETDIRLTDRYLMERFVYGSARLNLKDAEQQPTGAYTEVRGGKLSPGNHRPSLRWVSLDIETSIPRQGETYRLYSIALVTPDSREVLVVAEHGAASPDQLTQPVTVLATELEVLHALVDRINRLNPDVLIGWNLVQFDIDVLNRKYREHKIPFTIGRDGSRLTARPRYRQPDRIQVSIAGRLALDGIELLRAASYQFESFALAEVSKQLLGDTKLLTDKDGESGRGSDIERLYHTDLNALAAYNLQDCDLVWRIFEHTRLLEFAIERSLMTGLALDRPGGSVAAFENLYLPRLHRAGYVAPNMGAGYKDEKSPGGYVMDSRPGLFEHVLVLDFKSLYPSIIRTFRIDPMGLIEGLQECDPALQIPGFFGGQFHHQKHLLPDLIRQLGERRELAKQEGNRPLSQAIKIIMASCYGVLGSEGCRFHDTRLSASITKRSHQIIQQSSEWIEQQGHQVIYGDTDSVFVWLRQQVSDAEADRIGKQLMQGLNRWWQQRLQAEYNLTSYLEIEYETHYRRFFMPSIRGAETGSKKRYAGLITDADGKPEVVFKGLEAVRTDWTLLARQLQAGLYQRAFLDQPYLDWIRQQVEDLNQGRSDHLLDYRKRLRQPLADYQRQIPPHARAAQKLERWRAQQQLLPLYQYGGGWIRYRLCHTGPEPVVEGYPTPAPDYSHYLDTQIRPIVEALFHFTGDDVEAVLGQQRSLF